MDSVHDVVWFNVDDSFHSHPKALRAGNAACGLWTRCGAYAAQHLTDGLVPVALASMYGTHTERARLVMAGLWHEKGHDCPRCQQPPVDSYLIHDYLVYNRSAEKVRQDRAYAAERQRRSRETRRDGESDAARDLDRDVTRDSPGESNGPSPSPSPKGTSSPQRGRSRRSPETLLPPDLELDGDYAATAQRHGMSQDVASVELERFKAWHESKGSRFRSWPAAWRTWVLRWKDRQPPQGQGPDEPEWGR
jgi:hypothetical protein